MMALKSTSDRLIERLPKVRGRLTENAALGPLTWFRVGGPAEVLFRPADPEDLARFIAGTPADVPVTVIGVGSNLLIRDGGIRGVVVRLGRGFAEIRRVGDTLEAGAGALDVNVALTSQREAIAGLEFLSGIPGTIGGALRMNAGAYGREMVDVVLAAEAIDDHGRICQLDPATLGLTYRHSAVPESWLFTKAVLKAEPGEPDAILARIQDIRAQREASQPVRAPTGGSTFANPPGAKAWELIDKAGLRGFRIGGAHVSEKHCNFLINTGEATAADIERLGEEIRRRVKEMSGVELRWEIRIIGEAA
ncbi:MAG: UDP-N-acetylmuramate dehydrogenase [Alphaproteobacteria bacterium]|nr:UDP-N-acetylmuramate dehydrogenase [Alphaproteobacteria bacterium]